MLPESSLPPFIADVPPSQKAPARDGVLSQEEVAALLEACTGRDDQNYEHLSPHYLRAAVAEIDAYFDDLAKLTKAHLRYKNDTGSIEPLAA